MSNSLSIKCLEIAITLAAGERGSSGAGGTKTYRGMACDAIIEKPGLPDKNNARVRLYGLAADDMEQLSQLAWKSLESQKNVLVIRAGEEGGILSEAFRGEITTAHAVYGQEAEAVLQLNALTGYYAQLTAAPPLSVQGEAQVAQLVEQFAREAGFVFENQGVTSSVRNAVFHGSPLAKAQAAAHQVGAELIIDDTVMILKSVDAARRGGTVRLSPGTGLIGYPEFTQDGIACRTVYSPDVQYGGLIQVESQVPRANDTWKVSRLSHYLSAYTPGGGAWESHMEASHV